MLIGDRIYPSLTLRDTTNVTIAAFVITLLAGFYPAMVAARMEPVDALRAEK
jgi:ABC-type lipoprotein release transport system permease subunit